ncbi:MAG: FAD-binding protein [Candidatus Hodarchaeota archaeon]
MKKKFKNRCNIIVVEMSKMKEFYDKIIETDVLVVGSEGAGARAAIEVVRKQLKVVIVTKGKMGKCGCTMTAGADFMVDSKSAGEILNLPGSDPNDSPEAFVEDIILEGAYLSDQKIVERHVADAPERVQELIDWGMKLRDPPLQVAHWQRFPRGVMTTGADIVNALVNGVKLHNIDLVEDTMVLDLLITNGRVAGATALDLRTGEFIVIKAKAVVIATGGWHETYEVTTGTHELTGDGQYMAFRVGAELMDMEMVLPLAGIITWPKAYRGSNFLKTAQSSLQYIWLNIDGERFMEKYDPNRLERGNKEITSFATMNEVVKGKGGPHGGVFYTWRHLPPELLEARKEKYLPRWNYQGRDYSELVNRLMAGHSAEVSAAAHMFCGGIRINEKCETNIPGLYAAGEASAGLWGANRVSSACSQMVIEGQWAGESASEYAKGVSQADVDENQLKQNRHRLFKFLERNEGVKAAKLRRRLQKIASENIGPVRDGERLKKAINELEQMIEEELPKLYSEYKGRRYNMEWIDTIQVENMLYTLFITAKSALLRTESRGVHYRIDYPDCDNINWVKNLVVNNVDGDIVITTVEPNTDKIKPEKEVISYMESIYEERRRRDKVEEMGGF